MLLNSHISAYEGAARTVHAPCAFFCLDDLPNTIVLFVVAP